MTLLTAPALFSSPDNKSGQVLRCVMLVELYPYNTLRLFIARTATCTQLCAR